MTSLNTLPKISHPTFEVTIPSTKEKAKIRPMLAREEKILLIAKEGGDASEILSAVKQIVNNCMVDNKYVVNKLPLFDVEYMFLRIHAVSKSNKINLTYKDNEDEKNRSFEVDLDTIEVEFPPEDLSYVQINDTIRVRLRYPEASLYDDKEFLETTGEKVFGKLITKCLDQIYEGDKVYDPKLFSPQVLQKWCDEIPTAAYDAIKKFFINMPTLKHTITYTNDNGHERKIVLSTLNDFFMLR